MYLLEATASNPAVSDSLLTVIIAVLGGSGGIWAAFDRLGKVLSGHAERIADRIADKVVHELKTDADKREQRQADRDERNTIRMERAISDRMEQKQEAA